MTETVDTPETVGPETQTTYTLAVDPEVAMDGDRPCVYVRLVKFYKNESATTIELWKRPAYTIEQIEQFMLTGKTLMSDIVDLQYKLNEWYAEQT